MIQRYVAALLTAGIAVALPSTGYADHASGSGPVHTSPSQGGFTTSLTDHFHSDWTPEATAPQLNTGAAPTVEISTVLFTDFCSGLNWTQLCDPQGSAETPALAQVGEGAVLRALRRIDLPASELVVQPPGGKTLVNFATNFYTEQGEFIRTVRLLGQRVELRIWPSQFEWDFGDGASTATESPGAAYPDLEITHDYRRKGRVSPSVDTTYAAQFRVNGGAWRDVTGTVTIPGAPSRLEITTARPVLVGYR